MPAMPLPAAPIMLGEPAMPIAGAPAAEGVVPAVVLGGGVDTLPATPTSEPAAPTPDPALAPIPGTSAPGGSPFAHAQHSEAAARTHRATTCLIFSP